MVIDKYKFYFLVPNFISILPLYLIKSLLLFKNFYIKREILSFFIIFLSIFLLKQLSVFTAQSNFEAGQFLQGTRFLLTFFFFYLVAMELKSEEKTLSLIKWLFFANFLFVALFVLTSGIQPFYNAKNLVVQGREAGLFTNHHEIGLLTVLLYYTLLQYFSRFSGFLLLMPVIFIILASSSKIGLVFFVLSTLLYYLPKITLILLFITIFSLVVDSALFYSLFASIIYLLADFIFYLDPRTSKGVIELARFIESGGLESGYASIANRIEDYRYLKEFFEKAKVFELLFGGQVHPILGFVPTFEVGYVFYIYSFGMIGTLVLSIFFLCAVSSLNSLNYRLIFCSLLALECLVNIHQNYYILLVEFICLRLIFLKENNCNVYQKY